MKKVNRPFESFVCEACKLVGLFSTIPSWRSVTTSAKLQRMYFDLFECDAKSWNGERFFLIIVDDFTEYAFVYSLAKKRKAKQILKRVWLNRYLKGLTNLEIKLGNDCGL